MTVVLVLLVIVLVLGLLALVLVLRAARARALRRRQAAGLAPADKAAGKRDGALRRLDRLAREAFGVMAALIPETQRRYNAPLVLLAGAVQSGKSTMLEHSGLSRAVGHQADKAEELRWHEFDQGMVLEVGSSYLGLDTRLGDVAPAWQSLGNVMQRYRPRRPLDAVVLTIGADLLAGEIEEVELHGQQLQRRLSQMQTQFGLRLPVYLMITKADLLADFVPFVEALPPALRGAMLGWSSPYLSGVAYDGAWADAAFDSIAATIAELDSEIMAGAEPPAGKPGLLALAGAVDALREPLRAYLGRLIGAQSHGEPLLLRGIYLCGSDSAGPAFVRDVFASKVFAETGMVQPLPGQVWSRDRRVRSWRIATAVMLVIWLPMLIAADLRLRRITPGLLATLVQIKQDVEERRTVLAKGGHQPPQFYSRASMQLIEGMLDAESLVSYSIPFSWHGSNPENLDGQVETRFADGIGDILLPALGKAFNKKVHDLTGAPIDPVSTNLIKGRSCHPHDESSVSAPFAPTDNFDEVAAFGALASYVEELHMLEHHLQQFADLQVQNAGNLVELAELGRYSQAFYVAEPRHQADPRYFRQALLKAKVVTGQVPVAADYTGALACTLVHRHAELLDAVLDKHPLLLHAEAVDSQMHGAAPLREFDALKAELQGVKEWLGAPGTVWLHRRRLDFGKHYDELLNKVDGLKLFDSKRGASLRQSANERLVKMEAKLLAARDPASPVLQRSADGAHLLMSPEVAHMEKGLSALLSQSFMVRPLAQPEKLDDDRVPLWDLDNLNQLLVMAAEQPNYMAHSLGGFPLPIQPALKQFADARLKANLMNGIDAAQTPSDDKMAAWVRLGQAQKLLSALLENLARVGGAEKVAFAAELNQQAESALAGIDKAFEQDGVYLPKQGDFAWWTGSKNPAAQGFTGGDPLALEDYLAAQHEQVERSARLTRPVMRLYLDSGGTPNATLLKRWNAITRELERFTDKAPGARVAALHTFIRTDLSEMDQQNCQARALPMLTVGASDFFGLRARELGQRVLQRCTELTRSGASSAYLSLASAFRSGLANKFPFAQVQDHSSMAAEPDDVAAFFQTYDKLGAAAQQLLTRAGSIDSHAAERARAFLLAAERARTFLAPLVGTEPADETGYDLRVRFRVDELGESDGNNALRGEVDGNRIVEWTLQVGDQVQRFRNGEQGDTGVLRWRIGMPVTLTLRWAENAPSLPLQNRDPYMQVNGREVRYQFGEPWSLLRMLGRYRTGVGRSETLRFDVPVVPVSLPAPAQNMAPARVYLRLSLTPVNKKTALAYPAFPYDAPSLEGTVAARPRREAPPTAVANGQPNPVPTGGTK